MHYTPEQNKEIVRRFNTEVIEQASIESFRELVSPHVINHAAPDGSPNGAESMTHFLFDILKKGFPDVKVEILEQVAERDLVTSRKRIIATHSGEVLGIPATHKPVIINVIDIIRLKDGQYAEHWGMSNFAEVIAQLKAN
jgi:predicted ester cyclase